MNGIFERIEKAFDGASMAEIARRLGLAHSTIRNYRQGRIPDADVLLKIKNETNVSIDWLLTGVDNDGPGTQASPSGAGIDFDSVHAMFSNMRRPESQHELEKLRLELEIVILEAQQQIKRTELMRKQYEFDPQQDTE